jgi:hypothetical protein
VAKDSVRFLPFHALNEFMRQDYRLTVVRSALSALPSLPGNLRAAVDKLSKKLVRVPGFRNASQAPTSVRVAPTATAFEKNAELTAAILAAWAEAHPDLRQEVFDLLTARGWEVLPLEADRAKLPGFLTRWPKGEDFDVLNKAYAEAHPGQEHNTDDVSLMVVWVSGRLPVDTDEDDEAEEAAEVAAGTPEAAEAPGDPAPASPLVE